MQTEPRVGCGAAIIRDGELLLVQRLRPPEVGAWGLPGGKIDLFETSQDAVRREVAEELGISITLDRLLCVVDQIDREGGTHWVSPVYLVTRFSGEPRNLEPDKHGGVGWFPLAALPLPITTPTQTAMAAVRRLSGLEAVS
ncbi:MAG: NUDIX hydrolase [Parvularcula sp.]